MHVVIHVIEAYDLPPALCNYVFCQYKFLDEENTVVVPPMNASISNPGPKTNTMIFEHKRVSATGTYVDSPSPSSSLFLVLETL